MRIFILRQKQLQSFKKDPGKIVGGVAFTRYPSVEADLVQTAKSVAKFNLKITAKCHAHLQTPANIAKYPATSVG